MRIDTAEHDEIRTATLDLGQNRFEVGVFVRRVLARYDLRAKPFGGLFERIGESLSGETAALAVGIYGADLDTLDRVAENTA